MSSQRKWAEIALRPEKTTAGSVVVDVGILVRAAPTRGATAVVSGCAGVGRGHVLGEVKSQRGALLLCVIGPFHNPILLRCTER